MFIARWQVQARFGHKQNTIDHMRRWMEEIGPKAGTDEMGLELLTGSIGAKEAIVEANHTVESLAQLEQFFEDIGKIDAHKQWGKELEPYVVSGSTFWNIYRIL
ncbi:hypothetical protein [Chelativorans salis]|uniref:Uncharacterized protein n=1 Tax=Chelativorans salis TaxID=2978478 RepID=A0ABT2LPF7_9HYPH|nr:hypothetical protein [Chelativorans sp. EGI FJ00035]MCT7375944.1 hypothetical protein [Chelativorans sp. EGI FJ00035]